MRPSVAPPRRVRAVRHDRAADPASGWHLPCSRLHRAAAPKARRSGCLRRHVRLQQIRRADGFPGHRGRCRRPPRTSPVVRQNVRANTRSSARRTRNWRGVAAQRAPPRIPATRSSGRPNRALPSCRLRSPGPRHRPPRSAPRWEIENPADTGHPPAVRGRTSGGGHESRHPTRANGATSCVARALPSCRPGIPDRRTRRKTRSPVRASTHAPHPGRMFRARGQCGRGAGRNARRNRRTVPHG